MKGQNLAMVTGQMSFLWLMLKRIQIPLVLRMNCQRQIKETEKNDMRTRARIIWGLSSQQNDTSKSRNKSSKYSINSLSIDYWRSIVLCQSDFNWTIFRWTSCKTFQLVYTCTLCKYCILQSDIIYIETGINTMNGCEIDVKSNLTL